MDGIETIPRDTTNEAYARQLHILRGHDISTRAAMIFELSDNLRRIVRDGVRHRHPDWDEARVGQEALRIVLGERLFHEASGRTDFRMDAQREFLRRLIDSLDKVGIPYMVAGSLGSSLYGRPRATNDIDLVIAPDESQFRRFLETIGPEYYVSEEAAWAALKGRSAFNIIDARTGWKADLRIRQDRPFSDEEFRRRQKADLLGMKAWVVSPEDVVLSKLEWARESASEQQVRDVLGVLETQYGNLDMRYLRKWGEVLGVQDRLAELLEKAREVIG